VSSPWAAALDAAAAAPVTLVLGATDTGKSTLVTRLAGALAVAGHAVGVVDADLGQSDVGPPTTVGLGRVRGPIERLAEAELVALQFLGVTSPARCMRETADSTARLVRYAQAIGCTRVLVDTSGLVAGAFGHALKRRKIDAVTPDVLIALQRQDECEPILHAGAGARPAAIVRLPAPATTRRSAAVRGQARRRALEAHLAGAVAVTLDLTRVAARPAPAVRELVLSEVQGMLVGLDGRDEGTLGLGWVRAVDAPRARLIVQTAVAEARIAAVAIGRERYRVA
jgi:polynucleotide 5'-hydroxyl-kinase GRC3/NOL9